MLLVNKNNKLSPDFIPSDLVEDKDGLISSVTSSLPLVDRNTLIAFNKLKEEALKNNFQIFINSGYRSYNDQKQLIIEFLKKMSFEETFDRAAEPGSSEHQSGLAIDFVSLKSIDDTGRHYVRGIDMWEDKASIWVHENAHKFGFILRYPKDKVNITNQPSEPWHLRYVGVKHATIIKEMNYCLEEYLEEQEKIVDSSTYIPLIGVVGRVVKDSGDYPVISTGEYYRKAITKNHAAVVTIQPPQNIVYNEQTPKEVKRLTQEDKRIIDRILKELDGVLFPGGSKWYEFDEYIAKYCIDNKIPMFGICLGMQTIAYVDNLEVSLPKYKTYYNDSEIDHKQIGPDYVHTVNLKKGSHFYDLIKQDTIMVNSRHNYNIGGITNKLKISGYSLDGIAEYGEIEDYCITTQWHPELMADFDMNNDKLFTEFVERCRK